MIYFLQKVSHLSLVCGDQKIYLNPNLDVFLNPVLVVFVPKPNEKISTVLYTDSREIEN